MDKTQYRQELVSKYQELIIKDRVKNHIEDKRFKKKLELNALKGMALKKVYAETFIETPQKRIDFYFGKSLTTRNIMIDRLLSVWEKEELAKL